MQKSEVNGDTVWTCKYTFNSSATIEFKFCANDGDPWAASWGNAGNGNLTMKVEAREYTFTFNETQSSSSKSGAVYKAE